MAGDSHFRLAWVHARQLVPAFVQMVMVMASRLPPGPVGIVGTRSGIPRQALRLPGRRPIPSLFESLSSYLYQ